MVGKVLCIGDIILDSYPHGDVKRISEIPIKIISLGPERNQTIIR